VKQKAGDRPSLTAGPERVDEAQELQRPVHEMAHAKP
jgi:hypothetical protein